MRHILTALTDGADKQTIGDLEITFFRTFCRGANLRAMLADFANPTILQEIRRQVDYFFKTEFKGGLQSDHFVLGDESDPKATWDPAWDGQADSLVHLEDELYLQLSNLIESTSPGATHTQFIRLARKNLIHEGVAFSKSEKSSGNAQIIFHHQGIRCFGQIDQIFVHRHILPSGEEQVCSYLLVYRYVEVTDDPYNTRYPLLDLRMLANKFSKGYIIQPSAIVSHMAICGMRGATLNAYRQVTDPEYLLSLSLDRVSHVAHHVDIPKLTWRHIFQN